MVRGNSNWDKSNIRTWLNSASKAAHYDKAFGYEDYFPWWLRDAVAESGCKGMLATNYYCMEYVVGVEGFGIRPAMTVK